MTATWIPFFLLEKRAGRTPFTVYFDGSITLPEIGQLDVNMVVYGHHYYHERKWDRVCREDGKLLIEFGLAQPDSTKELCPCFVSDQLEGVPLYKSIIANYFGFSHCTFLLHWSLEDFELLLQRLSISAVILVQNDQVQLVEPERTLQYLCLKKFNYETIPSHIKNLFVLPLKYTHTSNENFSPYSYWFYNDMYTG